MIACSDLVCDCDLQDTLLLDGEVPGVSSCIAGGESSTHIPKQEVDTLLQKLICYAVN